VARRSALLGLVVLIQVLGPFRVDAQRTLTGAVRDSSGALLPGVAVSATGPALSQPRRADTDREGRYSFGDLPDGIYTLTFTLPGFVETTHTDVVLPVAAENPLDVVMRVGSMAQTYVLRGRRPNARCTMRVQPADPSIDAKMLNEPDATKDYTIRVVPPPCQASHRAQPR
jgi:hypothetical protein